METSDLPPAPPTQPSNSSRDELAAILGRSRRAIWGIAALSAVLNVLLLGGSIYMMLVYDMVLPGHSVPTLVALLVMITVVYMFQGVLEALRSRLLLHMSSTVDADLGPRIHGLIVHLARLLPARDALQPMRDLDQVRTFLSGTGPTALVDLPWMFFFIAVLFLLHPWLGGVVLVGGLVLIGLTVLTDRLSAEPGARLARLASARAQVAEGTRRHAETVRALGMEPRVRDAWDHVSRQFLAAQNRSASVTGTLSGISRVFRLLLQSVVLSVGALLVMQGRASGGVIFASSILSSRALAPVELAIANWRGFTGARQSWARLKAMLARLPDDAPGQQLPAPCRILEVDGLSLAPAGSDRLTVEQAVFSVRAGQAVAVIGPSGCGKSTLVRGLVGALPPRGGEVRLDGATLDQWSAAALGPHIGYLPQTVELLAGTVAQNIARFEPDAPADLIVAAARLAGVHDLILHLPDGYETQVGNDGMALSGGQRQRIALARALYRDPFLIVLDEPNSNLDQAGEAALIEAIRTACARGAIAIVVAHRPSVLEAADLLLVMEDGRTRAFGPRQEVLDRLRPGAMAAA